jgi:hypothetical protein
MKPLIALAILGIGAAISCEAADLYSIEATVTPHKEAKQHEAAARVYRLVDRGVGQLEELVAQPRVLSTVGSPGSFYAGPDRASSNYRKLESVSMDMAWPNQQEAGFAVCTITVKRGDRVLAKSKMQVTIDQKQARCIQASPTGRTRSLQPTAADLAVLGD